VPRPVAGSVKIAEAPLREFGVHLAALRFHTVREPVWGADSGLIRGVVAAFRNGIKPELPESSHRRAETATRSRP
jgi:hypothetical protein